MPNKQRPRVKKESEKALNPTKSELRTAVMHLLHCNAVSRLIPINTYWLKLTKCKRHQYIECSVHVYTSFY